MRNQLLITNGNSGGVAPQPLASSSARIEELPSTPNRVATTNNPSRHHHVQQIPSNHNQRPHLQNNPYIYAQQATYSQYPTIIQYQPNTSSSSTSQNQARHTGSSVYGWSQKPISYNAPLSHLPRNNPAPNLNAMPAAGTSSINGVPETRATPQPSVSSGNTHSSVLGDLSRVTGPGPFNEQQRLELFAEIVNAWAKTAQDNAEVYLDQLQLWLVKGNPSQNARSVSVKVRDPSGEMRAATREELVLRIRRAYGGYDTRSQPDRQSVHTHRSAPQDRALAQTAQTPSISHPSAISSSGLYTSIPLPPHASASRPSPVQAPLQNMNNLPPISTPSSSTAAGSPSTSLLRTPAQANKSTLAQDILRGFGGPKRPRSNDGDPNGRDPKRQALSDEGPTNSVQQPLHSSNQTQSTSQQAEVVQQAHSIPQPVPRLPQPVSPKTQPTKTPAKARKPESLVEAGSDAGPISLAQKEAPETKSAETATPDAEEVTSPLAPTLDLVHPISSPSPPNAAIEPSTPLTRRVSGAGSQPGSSKRPESFIVEETPPPSPMQRPGTPLFLASPAPSSSSVVILDGPPSPKSPTRANLRKGEKDTGQRRSVLRLHCVELPPAPAWVKHDLELSKQKRRKGKEREQVPVHRFLHRNVVISDSEEDLLADDNAAKHSLAARVQEG
ncbi:hypothetical protein VNI00_005771 [Paramarasmius palmivorus]|uniref:Uncharacterized protein n=1 Tax=Paramarasmius palmivorus TaxID=297713 RepID=A0AAW0DEI4_9AGAR